MNNENIGLQPLKYTEGGLCLLLVFHIVRLVLLPVIFSSYFNPLCIFFVWFSRSQQDCRSKCKQSTRQFVFETIWGFSSLTRWKVAPTNQLSCIQKVSGQKSASLELHHVRSSRLALEMRQKSGPSIYLLCLLFFPYMKSWSKARCRILSLSWHLSL